MRTLLLVCLLLVLGVVALREPGEGYLDAARRMASEASAAVTRTLGGDRDTNRTVSSTGDGSIDRQTRATRPAPDSTDSTSPVISPEELSKPTTRARRNSSATRPPAPKTRPGYRAPKQAPSHQMPDFLPAGPKAIPADPQAKRVEPHRLYREAMRLLEAIDQ